MAVVCIDKFEINYLSAVLLNFVSLPCTNVKAQYAKPKS